MRATWTLVLVVLVSGCSAAWNWSRPATTQEQFLADRATCLAQSPDRPGCVNTTTFTSCMASRGYVGPDTKGDFRMLPGDGSLLCE